MSVGALFPLPNKTNRKKKSQQILSQVIKNFNNFARLNKIVLLVCNSATCSLNAIVVKPSRFLLGSTQKETRDVRNGYIT